MSSYVPTPEFESTIRRALTDAVRDIEVPPLQRSAKHRARRFQVTNLLAVVALATFAFAGGLTAWQEVFEPERYIRVGGTGRLFNTRGAGGRSPCSPERLGTADLTTTDEENSCIATGSYRGIGWTLGVSIDERHGLCLWTETSGGGDLAGGSGGSCDEYTPGDIALSQSRLGDLPMLSVGAVPGATERLFLQHGGDDRFELEVYPTPANFPLDLKFYLVWQPDDAQSLIAVDEAGDTIATRSLDGSNEQGESEETERVVIASSEIDGVPWKLEAYGDTIDGRETVCTELTFRSPKATEENGFCHIRFHDRLLSALTDHPAAIGDRAVVSGVMSADVESLVLNLNKGSDAQVAILKPPEDIDPSLAFFIAFPRTAADGTISGVLVARDASGKVVAREHI